MAAASNGTAEVAKGRIEAEAIELGARVLGGERPPFRLGTGRFQKVRARLERANETRDPTGVGGSPREGPKREASKKKGGAKRIVYEKVLFFFSLFFLTLLFPKSCFFRPDFSSRRFAPSPAPVGSGEHAGSNGTGGATWFEPRIFGKGWARLRRRKARKERERHARETRNVEREEKKQVLFCKKREKHTKQKFSLPPRAPGVVCFFEGFGGREKRERRRD